VKLAKPHLDIGLFSNKRDEQLAFGNRRSASPTTMSASWAAACSSTAIT